MTRTCHVPLWLSVAPLVAVLWAATPAMSAWPANGLKIAPHGVIGGIAADGNGGVFVTFVFAGNAYLNRVGGDGSLPLGPNGFLIDTATSVGDPIADGVGGVYVPMENNGLMRLVRIAFAAGVPGVSWARNAASSFVQSTDLHAASDGAGGVLMAWSDKRTVSTIPANDQYKVFGQRIDPDGNLLWGDDGVMVAYSTDTDPRGSFFWMNARADGVVCRGPGEANFLWARETLLGGWSISSNRLNASGDVLTSSGEDVGWASYGATISDGAAGAYMVQGGTAVRFDAAGKVWRKIQPSHGLGAIGLDGSGGALHVWYRNTGTIAQPVSALFCQGYDAAGVELWGSDDVQVLEGIVEFGRFAIAPDHQGGAIVGWCDRRSPEGDIYIQRVAADGTPMFDVNGTPVRVDPEAETEPRIVSFAAGYAIIAWDGEDGAWAQQIGLNPVAVAITSFGAELRADGGVVLRATFRSDLGVDRVNVYRAASDDPMRLLRSAGAEGGSFEYIDETVLPGATYRYQVGVVDADGEFLSPVETIAVPNLALALDQNRPNPFNPVTIIGFTLAARDHTSLVIYSAQGQRVRTLSDAVQGPGRAEFQWDGRDDNGAPVASGMYFYKLTSGGHSLTRKMVLLK